MPSRYGDSGSGTAAFEPLSSSAHGLVCGVVLLIRVHGGGPHVYITQLDSASSHKTSIIIKLFSFLIIPLRMRDSKTHQTPYHIPRRRQGRGLAMLRRLLELPTPSSTSGKLNYDRHHSSKKRQPKDEICKASQPIATFLPQRVETTITSAECLMRASNPDPQASNRHSEHEYGCRDRDIHPLARDKGFECSAVAAGAVVLCGGWPHTIAISSCRPILEGAIVGSVIGEVRHGPVNVEDQYLARMCAG